MKKTRIAFIAALILMLLAGFRAFCAAGENQSAKDSKNASPAADHTPGPVVQVGIITGYKFQPSRVTIPVGGTVEWKNQTNEVHTVTDISSEANYPKDAELPSHAEGFSSGGIMPGETYRHTFKVPGRYKYFCKLHEVFHMTGEVVVTEEKCNPASK